MFTTDTTGCTAISFNSSGKCACSSDRTASGVYGQQSELVIHALLHGKLSVGADSACSIYVGGVTIWLVRRCVEAPVTRCLDKTENTHCSEVCRIVFSNCQGSDERRRLD